MVRRQSTTRASIGGSSYEFKAGDVIWAPYRRAPEWPAVIRSLYPKKATYVFLPIDDKSILKSSIFSCPLNKIRPFTGNETLPNDAKSDLRVAFKAAIDLVREKGVCVGSRQASDMVGLRVSEIDKQRVLVDLAKKITSKKEDDTTSNADTSSSASTPQWCVGEVAWLNIPNHIDWPVVIRELKKKYALVNTFPLKVNCGTERYSLSACHKFDLIGKNLDAAIKREQNYELRLALQGVQKFFNARQSLFSKSKEKSEDKGTLAARDEHSSPRYVSGGKKEMPSGFEEELESVGDSDKEALDSKEDAVHGSGDKGKRRLESMPSGAKRQKFSDVMKNLEAELNKKIENLQKGDLAWINRARSGRIVKWPILILRVDSDKKTCVCTELPLDDLTSSIEWCLNSEKTIVAQLQNIYLYDTVEVKIDEIVDLELKAAIQQADKICDGTYRPFEDIEEGSEKNEKSVMRENGCKLGDNNHIPPEEILRHCKSDMCFRHLMAIWTGHFSCARHTNYVPPNLPPLNFEIHLGSLLSEAEAIALVDHLDSAVAKFKDPIKSSLRRLHYVINVSLPEAVIFAITQIRYCTGGEANEIFEKAILHQGKESRNELVENAKATTGLEQLLKAASKVRCATLGND